MAVNLDAISNYLAEKEKEAQRRNSVDPIEELPSYVPTTLPRESAYIDPDSEDGAVLPKSRAQAKREGAIVAQPAVNEMPSAATGNAALVNGIPTEKDAGESKRLSYVQSFPTWADAEKAGDVSQQEWAYGMARKMAAEGVNPGEFVNMLSIYGEAESPQEKERRERREALGETFRGLGSLIGNAANLYYASKGATPVDLTSVDEKHRARMEQIKAKNDALDEQRRQILAKAKLGELQAERAERAAKAKAESDADAKTLEFKRDVMLKEIENAFRIGQIDAQTKADLEVQTAKAKSEKEIEALKHQYKMDETDDVSESFEDGNGRVWVSKNKLSKAQLTRLASYVEHPEEFKIKKKDGAGNEVESDDLIAQAINAIENNRVPENVLKGMGFRISEYGNRVGNGKKGHNTPAWKDEEKTTETDW